MIFVNCKRHKIVVPQLGNMTNAPTPNYSDIDAQARLSENEMCSVLEKKFSDSNIIKIGSGEMNKFLNRILDGILERVIKEFLSAEKIASYVASLGAFLLSVLNKLAEAAEKTETKLDDVIIDGIIKAVSKK